MNKPKPINFDFVADIYDLYVNVETDIPFFLKETEGFEEEILELMCGTGRVSIPLLEAGRKLVCVDYSRGMLDIFRSKISKKNYNVNLIEQDVAELNLLKFNALQPTIFSKSVRKRTACPITDNDHSHKKSRAF